MLPTTFKKSLTALTISSLLVMGDFAPYRADTVSEESYKQNIELLTPFIGWSFSINTAHAGCGDNNSCSDNYDTMIIIGDPIDDGWGDWDWGNDPYPGDGDGNGNDGGGSGSGGGETGEPDCNNPSGFIMQSYAFQDAPTLSNILNNECQQVAKPINSHYDYQSCKDAADASLASCNSCPEGNLDRAIYTCSIWGAFDNTGGGASCIISGVLWHYVDDSACQSSYSSALTYCAARYGGSGGPEPGGPNQP